MVIQFSFLIIITIYYTISAPMSSFVAKFFPIPQKQCCCRYAE
nr:MAG TPA: hypothetical protein [Inoviridae sp.]